jgi:hypothetical protein
VKEQGDVPRHWLKKCLGLVDQNAECGFCGGVPCMGERDATLSDCLQFHAGRLIEA